MHELALYYVGRFATTRAKLATYLNRKLRERGWEGDAPAEVEKLVERLAASGLVDDALYAQSATDPTAGDAPAGDTTQDAPVEDDDVVDAEIVDDETDGDNPSDQRDGDTK